jgi:uncharacterized protein (DUF2384 family)
VDLDPNAPKPEPVVRRTMAFRKRRTSAPPSAQQSRRQNDVIQSTWRHFGEPGPVIAFLNTPHEMLGGQPLHLAIESDEGLQRVETLLDHMRRKA